jgi:hypothetical protein
MIWIFRRFDPDAVVFSEIFPKPNRPNIHRIPQIRPTMSKSAKQTSHIPSHLNVFSVFGVGNGNGTAAKYPPKEVRTNSAHNT